MDVETRRKCAPLRAASSRESSLTPLCTPGLPSQCCSTHSCFGSIPYISYEFPSTHLPPELCSWLLQDKNYILTCLPPKPGTVPGKAFQVPQRQDKISTWLGAFKRPYRRIRKTRLAHKVHSKIYSWTQLVNKVYCIESIIGGQEEEKRGWPGGWGHL